MWLAPRVLPEPTKKRPRIAGASRFYTACTEAGLFFWPVVSRLQALCATTFIVLPLEVGPSLTTHLNK
jgi:hypothetical protein